VRGDKLQFGLALQENCCHGNQRDRRAKRGPVERFVGAFVEGFMIAIPRRARKREERRAEVEHGQRDNEDQPSGELVKKALSFVRIPVLNQQAGADNAQAVGGDGNRNRRQGEHRRIATLRSSSTVDHRKCGQRHERANSAARLRDFQRHCGKNNDIAFAQYRHTHPGKRSAGYLRRQQLQREGDLIKDEGGDGNHQ